MPDQLGVCPRCGDEAEWLDLGAPLWPPSGAPRRLQLLCEACGVARLVREWGVSPTAAAQWLAERAQEPSP